MCARYHETKIFFSLWQIKKRLNWYIFLRLFLSFYLENDNKEEKKEKNMFFWWMFFVSRHLTVTNILLGVQYSKVVCFRKCIFFSADSSEIEWNNKIMHNWKVSLTCLLTLINSERKKTIELRFMTVTHIVLYYCEQLNILTFFLFCRWNWLFESENYLFACNSFALWTI